MHISKNFSIKLCKMAKVEILEMNRPPVLKTIQGFRSATFMIFSSVISKKVAL